MATNPLYNTNDSPNNSTQPTKSVNRQGVYVPRTHNKFDMSYMHYKTQKFGQYEVPFVMECVSGDRITLDTSHEVRALPMNSPFLDTLTINKDFFLVPNEAIQPNTYDYIFKQPSQGDDVPEDAYNCWPIYYDQDLFFLQQLLAYLKNSNASYPSKLWCLLICEKFLSSGSLLFNMGYKLNVMFKSSETKKSISFDQFFDMLARNIIVLQVRVQTDNLDQTYIVSDGYTPDDNIEVDVYTILSLLRRYGSSATIISGSIDFGNWDAIINEYSPTNYPKYLSYSTDKINLDRLCAYQLACAQYYVNPQVDFLYNAQLYRDNLYTLYKRFVDLNVGDSSVQFFTMNGIMVPFDYCSQVYYENFGRNFFYDQDNHFEDPHFLEYAYDYINALFGWRESLRFGDYFTDSRTRPLAIGDNNVKVMDNNVDVVDISRSIVLQRFRNAVVKLGNNIGDYIRGIYGEDMSPDYHVPKFIVHKEFTIDGNEVANTTGTDQGNLITNLKSVNDSFVLDIKVDMPCILLGVTYFSLPRVYSQTKERFFFHKDRFDFFNPMMQYVGDQTVYNVERTDSRPQDEVFGYQSRYNEYKQRYSVVSGGFVSSLPAYTFVTDSIVNPLVDVVVSNVQSPDYIRAHDYEFNRFLSKIPGFSESTGFHFIIRYNNKVSAIRPMEVNPNIL